MIGETRGQRKTVLTGPVCTIEQGPVVPIRGPEMNPGGLDPRFGRHHLDGVNDRAASQLVEPTGREIEGVEGIGTPDPRRLGVEAAPSALGDPEPSTGQASRHDPTL